jgi:two-component system chemotaxis sensor kinase CheA
MSVDLKRFHATFFAESHEGLDSMEADLLRLERDGAEKELLDAIFRAIHSIKGSAGSLGFQAVAEFTHQLESVLDDIRQGRRHVGSRTAGLLLSSVDCVRTLLRDAEKSKAPDKAAQKAMQDILAGLIEQGQAPAREESSGQRASFQEVAQMRQVRIGFKPHPRFFHSGNDPLRLFRALEVLGEFKANVDLRGVPGPREFDPECCYLAWNLELRTDAPREQIVDVFEWVKDECDFEYAEGEQGSAPVKEALKKAERRKNERRREERRQVERRAADAEVAELRSGSIHVSTEKVDELVNLVGELVITRTILRDVAENFSMSRLERLMDALSQLERNTRDLQQSVMAVRMLPVSFLFGRFTRMVRDYCQASGKNIALEISGEQSEIDKTVIERLVDPLTHLVRNSLDHGVELPQARRAAGKSEAATLTLHAEHKGGNIEIHVSDDGRGLDFEKIRAKAVERGLLAPDQFPDEAALTEFIFAPGFSTADTVSDLSGRGVGLDVVRRNLIELNGNVEVVSRKGEGATFVIRLPLTLAILDGMSVAVGGENYIIPLSFIVECAQPAPGAVKSIAGRGFVFDVRGEYVPFVALGQLLNVGGATDSTAGIVVLLEAEGKKVAVLVDALLNQDQVVIKSLEANYRKVPYVAGATILGEGRVVLILDVNALVRSARG